MQGFYEPATYRIVLKSQLDESWMEWFEGLQIKSDRGHTVLEGELTDSAALHALLNRIHSLNLTILSLENLSKKKPNVDLLDNS